MSRRARLRVAAAALLGLLLLASCSRLGYISQAAWGQGRILLRRQPIARLIERSDTPPQLKAKLEQVEQIREFAFSDLGLPDNGSYRSYVEMPPAPGGGRRTAVVWNVVAAPELSIAPVTWCFPVAGCVSYRGYFSEARARRFGDRLRRQGFDVAVGGAAAYSTLGWFADPLFSTVAFDPPAELAGLIFHELSHQLVYVKDDTRFNESFATVVEIEGVRRWLAATGQPPSVMALYRQRQRQQDEVADLLLATRDRLREAYGRQESVEWKRRRKRELFAQLQRALEELERRRQGGAPSAGGWGSRLLDNADLVSVGDYRGLVEGFRRLLEQHHEDLPAFYAAVSELAELGPEERARRL